MLLGGPGEAPGRIQKTDTGGSKRYHGESFGGSLGMDPGSSWVSRIGDVILVGSSLLAHEHK